MIIIVVEIRVTHDGKFVFSVCVRHRVCQRSQKVRRINSRLSRAVTLPSPAHFLIFPCIYLEYLFRDMLAMFTFAYLC
jgi:hypothetical protein